MYGFAPEKTPSLAGRNFCLAICYFAFLRKRHFYAGEKRLRCAGRGFFRGVAGRRNPFTVPLELVYLAQPAER
jgi:hypothetical protein